MTIRPVRIVRAGAAREDFAPDPQKVLAGSAAQSVWNVYSGAAGRFSAGIWQGAAGQWRVHYTEEEFCYLLRGRVALRDLSGHVEEFRAGEAFVVPAGFEGTWENIEPAEKLYAIFEETAPD